MVNDKEYLHINATIDVIAMGNLVKGLAMLGRRGMLKNINQLSQGAFILAGERLKEIIPNYEEVKNIEEAILVLWTQGLLPRRMSKLLDSNQEE